MVTDDVEEVSNQSIETARKQWKVETRWHKQTFEYGKQGKLGMSIWLSQKPMYVVECVRAEPHVRIRARSRQIIQPVNDGTYRYHDNAGRMILRLLELLWCLFKTFLRRVILFPPICVTSIADSRQTLLVIISYVL